MILGVLVGLEAEAVLARRLGVSRLGVSRLGVSRLGVSRLGVSRLGVMARVGIGGATAAGGRRAVDALLAGGVTHLLSFGLAGGLDPALRPGALLVPDRVVVGNRRLRCDPALRAGLGEGAASGLLHSDALVAEAGEKQRLFAATGCASVDMESGIVAAAAEAAGLPFAVLRAVCDPAERTLPAAARLPLRPDGRVRAGALANSILRDPWQLPSLVLLGRDAGLARRALSRRIDALANGLTNV